VAEGVMTTLHGGDNYWTGDRKKLDLVKGAEMFLFRWGKTLVAWVHGHVFCFFPPKTPDFAPHVEGDIVRGPLATPSYHQPCLVECSEHGRHLAEMFKVYFGLFPTLDHLHSGPIFAGTPGQTRARLPCTLKKGCPKWRRRSDFWAKGAHK